jgi:hypothetical protein
MRWFFLLAITVLLPLMAMQPVWAQENPPALIVRLRDVAGDGVSGVEVIITDRSAATVLARATSDAEGRARFDPLPVADVLVVIQGHLSDGTPLVLPGADAQGIALILGAPPTTLELRSEADGTVLPDPEAELTLEPGIDAPLTTVDPAQVPPAPPTSAELATTVVAFPTAPLASTVVAFPTAQPVRAADTTWETEPQVSSPAEPPSAPRWLGLLLLGLFGIAQAIMVFEHLRGGKL